MSRWTDSALPANLTGDWLEAENNAGRPFPSYARLLPQRGTSDADSRYSWTVDFAARRASAREEMRPILEQASETRTELVDLKQKLKRLKKTKASDGDLAALVVEINRKEKARDLEAQAAIIDAAVFDLKAVNPSTVAKFDGRSSAEIIQSIHDQGSIVMKALARLATLIGENGSGVPNERAALG
jgi:type I restriction enzyme M protein